ncbi:unnamed protein product [Caretta caretta]
MEGQRKLRVMILLNSVLDAALFVISVSKLLKNTKGNNVLYANRSSDVTRWHMIFACHNLADYGNWNMVCNRERPLKEIRVLELYRT